MNPREYLQHRKRIMRAIQELRTLDMGMYELASAAPFPANARPANADDIQPGAIIWYKSGVPCWSVVAQPKFYGDAFKAYIAEDGCRYGLHDAWIEIDANQEATE